MIEAQSLSCRRGGKLVFREATFRLAPGAILQITGANGSGKSSLLRVLAGLLPKAEGAVFWQGKPITEDIEAHHQRLHYIGHLDALKPTLTGAEILAYWRTLRPCPQSNRDSFGTAAFLSKPVRLLSAGQKRRLALSRLTLDDAPLWLLDEPATSLDADGQNLLLAAIHEHRSKGGIVIAAMHHVMNTDNSMVFAMPEVG
jgi:heme exporter protein A